MEQNNITHKEETSIRRGLHTYTHNTHNIELRGGQTMKRKNLMIQEATTIIIIIIIIIKSRKRR